MFKKLFLYAFLLLLAVSGPAWAADYIFQLPAGVTIGEINGAGSEQLSQALKKRTRKGFKSMVLSGKVSLKQESRRETEEVPLAKDVGKPYDDYLPDPFTGRVWRQEVQASQEELESFKLDRYLGLMSFDWTLSSIESGKILDEGQLLLDINRTSGGYLAQEKMLPKSSAGGGGKSFEKRLADDMVRLLALNLGRAASASELETASDKWSRQAKNLAASGDWEGAKKQWEELLKMNPDYGPALYNMGVYWEINRKPEEALRYYRAAFVSDASVFHRQALSRLTETLRRAERLPTSRP